MGDNNVPRPDRTRPNIARVYDYLLGGKDNFAADRELAELAIRIVPDAKAGLKTNRAFLRRAVRYLTAEAGISQFLDIGSGLPTQGNVHEIAQDIDSKAHVVYIDHDPLVLAHARALLTTDYTRIVRGDLRDPTAILNDPAVRDAIDFDRPVALLVLGVLHHINDAEDPDAMMATLRDTAVSGSHLVISHLHNPGSERPEDAELAKVCEEIFNQMYGAGRWRGTEAILNFFGDWDLLPPGLVPTPEWRPDPDDIQRGLISHYLLVGGVAKKP